MMHLQNKSDNISIKTFKLFKKKNPRDRQTAQIYRLLISMIKRFYDTEKWFKMDGQKLLFRYFLVAQETMCRNSRVFKKEIKPRVVYFQYLNVQINLVFFSSVIQKKNKQQKCSYFYFIFCDAGIFQKNVEKRY